MQAAIAVQVRARSTTGHLQTWHDLCMSLYPSVCMPCRLPDLTPTHLCLTPACAAAAGAWCQPSAPGRQRPKHVLVQFNMVTRHGCAGGPSGWGNSAFAASMAQVESAVEAAEMKAPSRWRTAEAIAAVHLWSPMVRHTAVHGLLWHGAGS